jgi:hypothetical protein
MAACCHSSLSTHRRRARRGEAQRCARSAGGVHVGRVSRLMLDIVIRMGYNLLGRCQTFLHAERGRQSPAGSGHARSAALTHVQHLSYNGYILLGRCQSRNECIDRLPLGHPVPARGARHARQQERAAAITKGGGKESHACKRHGDSKTTNTRRAGSGAGVDESDAARLRAGSTRSAAGPRGGRGRHERDRQQHRATVSMREDHVERACAGSWESQLRVVDVASYGRAMPEECDHPCCCSDTRGTTAAARAGPRRESAHAAAGRAPRTQTATTTATRTAAAATARVAPSQCAATR